MGIFEICAGFHNFKERGWSGPFHSLGWAFSHMYMRERILGPAKVWDEFLHTNDKLQGSNRISRYFLQRKADKYFSYLTSIFPYTQRQKGLSISYRDGILDKVNETFAGIDCCRQSVLAKEDSFPIIDPWEMDIPELDDKPKITNPWDVDAPEIKSLLQGVKG